MVDANTEDVIYEVRANLQKNVETVGGKLLLFSDRLVFEPHIVNIQKEPLLITLSSISEINLGWTKLFGVIPLFPNAIIVSSDENKLYRFTVFRRKELLDKIKKQSGLVGV